jgi:hypothetical protein
MQLATLLINVPRFERRVFNCFGAVFDDQEVPREVATRSAGSIIVIEQDGVKRLVEALVKPEGLTRLQQISWDQTVEFARGTLVYGFIRRIDVVEVQSLMFTSYPREVQR